MLFWTEVCVKNKARAHEPLGTLTVGELVPRKGHALDPCQKSNECLAQSLHVLIHICKLILTRVLPTWEHFL